MKIYNYTKCEKCGAAIAITDANKEGKCPYKLCENFGFSNEEDIYKENNREDVYNKYVGKHTYVHEIGDCLTSIGLINADKLIVVSTLIPDTYVISTTEFDELLSRVDYNQKSKLG